MGRIVSLALVLILAGPPPANAKARHAAPVSQSPSGEKATATSPADTAAAREDRAPTPPARPRGLETFDPNQVTPPVARLDSVEIYYAWGDFASVARLLGGGAAQRPREFLLLGWADYRLGRMNDAVRTFEAGLAITPDNLDLMNGRAFALYRTGQPQVAEAEFRHILERNPDREESIRGLAIVLYTSNRFEECLPTFDKLLRAHPNDAELQHQLAKSVDGMLTAWRAAGRTPAAMVEEAWRLAEAGNRRSAFEIFTWVLIVDPFHPGARLGLGTFGAEFGREPEARRCLEDLLRENPKDVAARSALARLHLAAGRPAEARAQVQAWLALRPDDPAAKSLEHEIDGTTGSRSP
jgi:tetratricopeptide (TPR) repeat protein